MQPPAADAGDLERGGPGSRPTTAGWPTSATGARAAGRHRADHAARRRRRGGRDPLGAGARPDRWRAAARARLPVRASRRCTTPDYEPIWTRCEELGMPVNHHSGSAAPPMGPTNVDAGHLPARGDLVGPPRVVAPDLRRRAGAAPRPAVRLHRAGHGVDPGGARPARLLLRPDGAPPSDRRSTCGARPSSPAVAQAERVLGPPVPRRVQLHPRRRGRAAPRGGRRPDHVGQRLPAQRGQLPVLPRGPAAGVRRLHARRGAAMVGGNAAALYGFDLDALAPLAARVGPSVAEVARPLHRRRGPGRGGRCPAFVGFAGASEESIRLWRSVKGSPADRPRGITWIPI